MTAAENPAALLREAANVVRQRAERAGGDTSWQMEPGHLDGWPQYVKVGTRDADTVAECWRQPPGAAVYIAMMGPQLGQALADWLEAEAEAWSVYEAANDRGLAVARLILGSQEPS